MARTIRNIILHILNSYSEFTGKREEYEGWISPGELFADAQDFSSCNYKGTQERLLQRADDLARQGVIESRPRGRMQNNWYRIVQNPSPTREPHYMKQVRRTRACRVCSSNS
jgi:hypothetical protein